MKKIIENFETLGGKHCITNSLKQVFACLGHTISEEMLFGLGEGLDFTYINLANAPMVSGRSKVGEFEDILSQRMGIIIGFKQGKNYDRIFTATKKMIDNNTPVLVYVDMPYLPYLSLSEDSHFGGHAVVIFGYDDEQKIFFVSDRDNSDCPMATPKGNISENYHIVSYEQMQKARSSAARPFPANNKYIDCIDFGAFQSIQSESVLLAIMGVCDKMLNPPAKLKGITGISKFLNEILKWSAFDDEKIKRAGVTNYFQISKDGGTGGGIFRNMYGNFLIEASDILKNKAIQEIGLQFVSLAAQWDNIAADMWQLSLDGKVSSLPTTAHNIKCAHDTEHDLLLDLKKECMSTSASAHE